MARRGRPRKNLTPIDKEKMQLTDDIVNQLKYNSELSDEQIFLLKKTLDDTFKSYDLEKQIDSEEKSIKDINQQALDDFLKSKKAESKSKTTIYNYGNELSKLFTIINKDYRLLTAQDIREYMDYRKEHDKVAPVTIQNIRMYLMSFYKWAFIEERVSRNPMDKIGTIKTEKKVIETFTDEEIEMLRCACKNERDLAIVDLLSSSGMRVSELTGLDKKDVNFETGEIKVFGKGSKEYYDFSRKCFRIFLFMTLVNGLQPLTTVFFTSIGKAIKGAFIALTRQILFLLPLVVILPKFFGIDGIMYAGPIADFGSFILVVVFMIYEFRTMRKLEKV